MARTHQKLAKLCRDWQQTVGVTTSTSVILLAVGVDLIAVLSRRSNRNQTCVYLTRQIIVLADPM